MNIKNKLNKILEKNIKKSKLTKKYNFDLKENIVNFFIEIIL